uniref:Glutathione synthetase n=1 Tax=Globodera rostochiensis TaxID=31243 RepID=A0A914HXD3_GLORO
MSNKILSFVLFLLALSAHLNATPPNRNSDANEIITTLTLRDQQQVIIRRMREEDINEAGEIIRAAYLDDCKNIEHATSEERCQMFTVPVERTRHALHNIHNDKDSVLFVAELAEKNSNVAQLLGCCRVKLNPEGNSKDNGPFGQIGPIAARIGLQGTGIGTALIRVAEEYVVRQWHVCEMQLDAHSIPKPVEGVVHPMTPLLQFYAKRGYRRVGKTMWFDPANSNYVTMPGHLCHLERMVKDLCVPSATTGGDGTKRGREQQSAEKSPKHSVKNYVKDLIKDDDHLNVLVEAAVDLAHNVGLIKRLDDSDSRSRMNSDFASIIPFTLFPSPYPRQIFLQALDVQTGLQKLYFRVSCDYAFLAEQFKDVIKTNDLMRRMAEIMHEIQREGQKQAYTLFLARSDYMVGVQLDKETGQKKYGLKQVEMNIGSVVGSAFGPRTAELHRQMLQKVGMDASNLPESRAFNTLAEGLYLGWQKFGDPDAVVVFAVLQGSVHRFDERAIEYELQRISEGKVNIVRMSSKEAYHKLRLDEDFKLRLSADGRVVALVYSRSGPLPEWTDEEWHARRTIERSTAIKTSTMFSALSSSKKVQQVLAKPGMIERFLPDPEDKEIIAEIRKTFAGLWGLEKDDDETRNLVQHAIDNPDLYVLKPQNEGGGHNYFDEELREKLQHFTHEERAAHTLMERIQPMIVKNYMVRPHEEPVLSDVVAELGVFGCLLGDKRNLSILHNKQHGYLVRTKPASSTESGITAGGVYDSLNLF